MRTKYDIDPVQAAIDEERDKEDLKKIIRISVWVPTGVVILVAIAAIVTTFLLE